MTPTGAALRVPQGKTHFMYTAWHPPPLPPLPPSPPPPGIASLRGCRPGEIWARVSAIDTPATMTFPSAWVYHVATLVEASELRFPDRTLHDGQLSEIILVPHSVHRRYKNLSGDRAACATAAETSGHSWKAAVFRRYNI
jgi:hypothetical protein